MKSVVDSLLLLGKSRIKVKLFFQEGSQCHYSVCEVLLFCHFWFEVGTNLTVPFLYICLCWRKEAKMFQVRLSFQKEIGHNHAILFFIFYLHFKVYNTVQNTIKFRFNPYGDHCFQSLLSWACLKWKKSIVKLFLYSVQTRDIKLDFYMHNNVLWITGFPDFNSTNIIELFSSLLPL